MKEHPKPVMFRFYQEEKKLVKKMARRIKVSEAEIVRNAVQYYFEEWFEHLPKSN